MIKSRRLRLSGHVARIEEGRSAFKILTDKPTGNRPSGKPGRGWEDIIIMDRKEIGINTRNGIDSALGRDNWEIIVYVALKLWIP